ncbi:DUF2184 domain-containing protein [Pseudomonas resinovorans]|uniref:DUF2184 domain-containing protein n=1 Tax=Metapseudomonas resinovorans TaxID=53412 RepID=A0ABT4YAE9_METRE|nr:DUF2184 domain-containing protein [Pseudomonas resinovorans]MDA8485854.1 DUF2184 domain-containing protein [Pseudomonas resinovorans]
MSIQQDLQKLAFDYGVHFMHPVHGYINQEHRYNAEMAADAQPGLVTQSNSGIPAFLANYQDPQVIEVLVTPSKGAVIFSEAKKGDWTTRTSQFPIAESTGEVDTYGDFSNAGQAGANVNWVPRESYHFQTITQWGENELATMGLARINWAAQLNAASALVIQKALNKMYFFGVQGLQNYGALNDPDLSAPVQPLPTGAAGSRLWANKDGQQVYDDISEVLFKQLNSQMNGIIDNSAKMTLAMSPTASVALLKTNQYNVNTIDQLKKNFPNLRLETAVEYSTASGELVQLLVDNVDGIETAYCAFTEKMRAHAVVVEMSSFRQKKSAGGWGCIIRRPVAIAQMLGV